MYRQVVCHVTAGHEVGNFPSESQVISCKVAVRSGRSSRRWIGMMGKSGQSPRIRQRLEQREVTEIFVSQQLVQIAEFIRCVFQARCNLVNLTCNRPVHTFNLCTCLQIDNTVAEQVQRFFTNLLSIMPCLQHTALIQVIPNLIKFCTSSWSSALTSKSSSIEGSEAVSSTSKSTPNDEQSVNGHFL